MSFFKSKTPEVKDIAVPSRSSSEVQMAAEEERRKIAASSKSVSWLTGGLGVPKSNQNYAASKLLSGTA
jgi:hypothetical protein